MIWQIKLVPAVSEEKMFKVFLATISHDPLATILQIKFDFAVFVASHLGNIYVKFGYQIDYDIYQELSFKVFCTSCSCELIKYWSSCY